MASVYVQANDFIRFPFHPRVSALNGGFLSIASGIESQLLNPAGLGEAKRLQATSHYAMWFEKTSVLGGGILLPTRVGRLAVSYEQLTTEKMDYLSG
ncbi:MAG TPA: hypothetical protein VJC03_04560, partial [bacterium]|nr:hypothetical protein [bacterium]